MPKIGCLWLASPILMASLLSSSLEGKDKPLLNDSNRSLPADQSEVIQRALKAIKSDAVIKGRELATYRWKLVLRDEPPKDSWANFDRMMDEYIFNYAMKAANSDSNYPKVAHVYTPPHRWQGMDVPGSRWGGDNPDNVYRIIPIDGHSRFRLDGKSSENPPSNVSYTLVGNWETSKTLSGIESTDVVYNSDGSFSLTLDPAPAGDRVNHIQTHPGARLLFIRDSLGSWDQTANSLTIHRLDKPDAPPMSDEQVAALTAEIAVDGVPQVYWFYKMAHGSPNNIDQIKPSGINGGLVTQRGASGYAILADDEAMVLTMAPSDAAYYSVVAYNNWFITHDYANHTVSLNNSQVKRNANGTVTFVIAPKDPGVHNWVDTAGENHVLLVIRAQGLSMRPAHEPTIHTRVVKVGDLRSMLPSETVWVTPEQRAAQIGERQRQIAARMADH